LIMVYLPLLAAIASFLFDWDKEKEAAVFVSVEILAVVVFVSVFFIYPKVLNSDWFRHRHRVAAYWRVNVVADWTMTYRKRKGLPRIRHTCKYEGEFNEKGEPHGLGRWFDDAFDGEVLTGTWENGVPVAPFYSRHYGKGDTFSAVRIAFVMASDDEFSTNKFWPSNAKPPRCGVAAVECSVSGAFYNELPLAEYYMGPDPFDAETSVKNMCNNLAHNKAEREMNVLQIKTDSRGVQVEGHVHAETGETFSSVDEILIRVERGKESISPRSAMAFMPRPKILSNMAEAIAVYERSEVNDDKEIGGAANMNEELEEPRPKLTLHVHNWSPTVQKEALIFIHGFNTCLKNALQNLGQLMAMTKLDTHVYPILYAWPCGQVLSYHSASRTAHSEQNHTNFLQLCRGLQNAGFTNVHLMSHSMGAQTLVGAFCDKSDGSQSDVARCFYLASGQHANKPTNKGSPDSDEGKKLLVCKTMTMLNPDFPVEAFVSHGFRSMRRVCDTITLVGDRHDKALFWSQFVNGIGVRFGYKQPKHLTPNKNNTERLRLQKVIGKSIDCLYLQENRGDRTSHNVELFQQRAPLVLVIEGGEDLEKPWLDLDVIDTTGLDTNIANIRHSAYNLNPILLNDLEELITTGQRAMKRGSLLYRDGNIFSYCHAPSYVSM